MLDDGAGKFRDEKSAYEFVESRVWPEGPVCPHCGDTSRIGRLEGGSTRIHTYKCYACRKPFTVKLGTIFEDSKVPMYKWLQLIMLDRAVGDQLNAHRISVVLAVTPKTAAAMLRRVRRIRASDRSNQ
jgi:transposase-like protein